MAYDCHSQGRRKQCEEAGAAISKGHVTVWILNYTGELQH